MSFHNADAVSLVPSAAQDAALSAVLDTAMITPGTVADVIAAHPSRDDLWTLLGHPAIRPHVADAICAHLIAT